MTKTGAVVPTIMCVGVFEEGDLSNLLFLAGKLFRFFFFFFFSLGTLEVA